MHSPFDGDIVWYRILLSLVNNSEQSGRSHLEGIFEEEEEEHVGRS